MVKLYGLGENLGFPGRYRLQHNRQSRSAAGNIKSMKKSNDSIEYRTFDLPACSASPHPTAPSRVPIEISTLSLRESEGFMNFTFSL
jgi:hypothetical protein